MKRTERGAYDVDISTEDAEHIRVRTAALKYPILNETFDYYPQLHSWYKDNAKGRVTPLPKINMKYTDVSQGIKTLLSSFVTCLHFPF